MEIMEYGMLTAGQLQDILMLGNTTREQKIIGRPREP